MCVYVYHVQGEQIRAAVQAAVAVSTVPDLRTTKPKEKKGQSKHRNLNAACTMHYSFIFNRYRALKRADIHSQVRPQKEEERFESNHIVTLQDTNQCCPYFQGLQSSKPSQVEEQKEKRFEILLCGLQFSPQSDACHNIFGLVCTIS